MVAISIGSARLFHIRLIRAILVYLLALWLVLFHTEISIIILFIFINLHLFTFEVMD